MGSIIIPIFFGIFILIFVGSYIYDKKRCKEIMEFAENSGMKYAKLNTFIPKKYMFELFNQGYGKKAKNYIFGNNQGIELEICDYQYTTGSGKNRSNHYSTICILTSENLHLLKSNLRPEIKLLDWLGEKLGGKDIDFDEDPEFSDSFVLQSTNEDLARKIYNSKLRGYLVSKRNFKIHVETYKNSIMVHYGKKVSSDKFPELMETAFSLMPLYSMDELE
jgi:hypothetical protein